MVRLLIFIPKDCATDHPDVFFVVDLGANDAGVSDSEQLRRLSEEFVSWRMETWPNYGTRFGFKQYNDKLVQYTEQDFIQQQVVING